MQSRFCRSVLSGGSGAKKYVESPIFPPFAQLDPHIARAPIVLCKEEPEGDPVVQWIRAEFTKLDDQVPPHHHRGVARARAQRVDHSSTHRDSRDVLFTCGRELHADWTAKRARKHH